MIDVSDKLLRDEKLAVLTDGTREKTLKSFCSDAGYAVDITGLSDETLRQLPEHIEARIIFEGDELTLYAKSLNTLTSPTASKINFPNLESFKAVYAEQAVISAPHLKNVEQTLVASHLNDVRQCKNVKSITLTAEDISLRGVKSIGFAHFTNAAAVVLHDTETITSEVRALQAKHIELPALQTLRGYFNSDNLQTLGFSSEFIGYAKPSVPHGCPLAQIKALDNASPVGPA